MTKKLIKYYFRRNRLFEILGLIFLGFYAVMLTVSIIEFKTGEGFSMNPGLIYFIFFTGSNSILLDIQDNYFIHTLPVEKKDYLRSKVIYSFLSMIKNGLMILILMGINILYYSKFVSVLTLKMMIVTSLVFSIVSYLLLVTSKVINDFSVDLESNENVRIFKKNKVINIILVSLLLVFVMYVLLGFQIIGNFNLLSKTLITAQLLTVVVESVLIIISIKRIKVRYNNMELV
ncbi:MAG: hypothetical protein RBQ97_04845 [Acholeplasma sp.]|nr:hypothetical protein [Acholeplasma sp.]